MRVSSGLDLKGLDEHRDGRLLERPVGETRLEVVGEKATSVVVFAEKGDVHVLGVHALEGLGLEVDPISRRVRKEGAMLAV